MSDRVTRHDSAGLCTLTLNRPDKLNALDTATFAALDEHLAALEKDDTIGCVVLRGAGKGFCAGADLNEFATGVQKPTAFKAGVIARLAQLPKPTIAAIHGVCFTGGLELALACDFLIADAAARFADTHGKWGLVCSWGMSQRLPRRIGVAAARRMMMTGCVVDAAEAKALGLIDLLAPAGKLEEALKGLVDQILANSWFTNAATKTLLIESDGLSLADGLAYERDHHPGRAPDYQDRLARFSKK